MITSSFFSRFTPTLTTPASTHLDAARALAAFLVLFEHVRVLFFIDYAEITGSRSLFVKGLYYVAGLGHECVVVFFVLSGLFISRSVLRRHQLGTWSWVEYLRDRCIRLYIVLVPGLFLGLLWDRIGLSMGSARDLYYRPLLHFGDILVSQNLTAADFMGNLVFLQTIVCRSFGSNGSLWSLANEFWYYLLFPAMVLVVRNYHRDRGVSAPVVGYGAFAGAVVWMIGAQKSLGFMIWLMGLGAAILGAQLPVASRWSRLLYPAAISLLIASLALARMRFVPLAVSDVVVGVSFALLVTVWLRKSDPLPAMYSRVAVTCAGFSYSLYVLHLPVILLLRGMINPQSRWQPDIAHLYLGACILVVTIAYAYAIARLTEGQTDRVRKWLGGRRQSAAPPAITETEVVRSIS